MNDLRYSSFTGSAFKSNSWWNLLASVFDTKIPSLTCIGWQLTKALSKRTKMTTRMPSKHVSWIKYSNQKSQKFSELHLIWCVDILSSSLMTCNWLLRNRFRSYEGLVRLAGAEFILICLRVCLITWFYLQTPQSFQTSIVIWQRHLRIPNLWEMEMGLTCWPRSCLSVYMPFS